MNRPVDYWCNDEEQMRIIEAGLDGLELLLEINDALVLPAKLQAKMDAFLDRIESPAAERKESK